jgi:exodeoxyribonuclease V gamma subunit
VYRKALTVAQMSGRAPAGPFAKVAIDADCERFARWYGELAAAGITDLAQWQSIRIGRGDERSHSDVILPPIAIELPATSDRVPRRVNLYGTLGFFSPRTDGALRMIARSNARARDFLDPFLAAIALSAADQLLPEKFTAIVIGDPPRTGSRNLLWRRTFRPPAPAAAREYLAGLILEMLSGPHDYFLPIEAVDAIRRAAAKGGDVLDSIDGMREGFGSCSSDFGPVRHGRDFEPPDEHEIEEIIRRRFGPIQELFEERTET